MYVSISQSIISIGLIVVEISKLLSASLDYEYFWWFISCDGYCIFKDSHPFLPSKLFFKSGRNRAIYYYLYCLYYFN